PLLRSHQEGAVLVLGPLRLIGWRSHRETASRHDHHLWAEWARASISQLVARALAGAGRERCNWIALPALFRLAFCFCFFAPTLLGSGGLLLEHGFLGRRSKVVLRWLQDGLGITRKRPPHRYTHLVRAHPADGEHAYCRRAHPAPWHLRESCLLRLPYPAYAIDRGNQLRGVAAEALVCDVLLLIVD